MLPLTLSTYCSGPSTNSLPPTVKAMEGILCRALQSTTAGGAAQGGEEQERGQAPW